MGAGLCVSCLAVAWRSPPCCETEHQDADTAYHMSWCRPWQPPCRCCGCRCACCCSCAAQVVCAVLAWVVGCCGAHLQQVTPARVLLHCLCYVSGQYLRTAQHSKWGLHACEGVLRRGCQPSGTPSVGGLGGVEGRVGSPGYWLHQGAPPLLFSHRSPVHAGRHCQMQVMGTDMTLLCWLLHCRVCVSCRSPLTARSWVRPS